MTVLLWGAIATMGLLTASLVFELLLVHHRRTHGPSQPTPPPAPRPAPRQRRRSDPHEGWFT